MKLDRPLCVFDLEATGVDPANDRIVDISIVRREPDGAETSLSSLVDPQVPIPPESTAIHKITDAMVSGQPTLKELVPRILTILDGADLCGYNLLKYDVPLLAAEFKRAGFDLPMEGRRIADSYVIFTRKEKRDLSAAYKFFCGKDLSGAHRAEADARATVEILFAQVEHYADLPKDMAGLSAFCTQVDANRVDAEGKFVWRNGEPTFSFGNKHRGKSLRDVIKADRGYIEWMIGKGNFGAEVIKICKDALAGVYPVKKG
jgi:DNA polymerase-3 subunit epsilon